MNTVLFVNATIGFSDNLFLVIVAFLQNTTIEYSLEYLCVCVHAWHVSASMCVCVCVFLQDNSKNSSCRSMKFEYTLLYENISHKFDDWHCRIKVKVKVGL